VNLGSGVNSVAADLGRPLMDSETETSPFTFTRPAPARCPAGSGVRDIYSSTLDENGEFTPAVLSCLNSAPASRTNNQPSGGTGSSCSSSLIVWAVSAQATYGFDASEHGGSVVVPGELGSVINTAGIEGRAALSFDGKSLYFSLTVAAVSEALIYLSRREKKVTDAWSAPANLEPWSTASSGEALVRYEHTDKNHGAAEPLSFVTW